MISKTEPFEELQEYSVQQLMDCDDQNFVCEGGWMYEAYEYVQAHGINLQKDYPPYKGRQGNCDKQQVDKKWHFKNTGMIEHDEMTNEEMKR